MVSIKQKKKSTFSNGDYFMLFLILLLSLAIYMLFFSPDRLDLGIDFELTPSDSSDNSNLSDNQEIEVIMPDTEPETLSYDFLKENCVGKLKLECEALEFNNDDISDCFFVFTEFTFHGVCIPVNCHSDTLQFEDICERYDYCEWLNTEEICREIDYKDISDSYSN